jgi:hypothetical protein
VVYATAISVEIWRILQKSQMPQAWKLANLPKFSNALRSQRMPHQQYKYSTKFCKIASVTQIGRLLSRGAGDIVAVAVFAFSAHGFCS